MAKPNKPSKPAETDILTCSHPIEQAFTLERVKDGWSFVTLSFQDDKIINIVRSEPDLKAVIIEKFKIAAFKYWSSIG